MKFFTLFTTLFAKKIKILLFSEKTNEMRITKVEWLLLFDFQSFSDHLWQKSSRLKFYLSFYLSNRRFEMMPCECIAKHILNGKVFPTCLNIFLKMFMFWSYQFFLFWLLLGIRGWVLLACFVNVLPYFLKRSLFRFWTLRNGNCFLHFSLNTLVLHCIEFLRIMSLSWPVCRAVIWQSIDKPAFD